MDAYLADIDFPQLSDAGRDRLDSHITVDELSKAIAALQSNKAPGPDGLSVEFYQTNMDLVALRLHALVAGALEEGCLPPSMSKAVIPKPGKDPELCASYRPISLIDIDAKIFAKVLFCP